MPVARFELPDGRIARFEVPEGTTPEQAQSMIAMEMAPQQAPKKGPGVGTGEAVLQGMRDPIDGGAQLLTNLLPKGLVEAGNKANNWLADKTGLVGRLPEGGVDQQVREREAAYQAKRGDDGIDWARMGGNILSPANIAVASRVPAAASTITKLGAAAASGGAGAALQPVVGQGDYWEQKGDQVKTGAAFGMATVPAAAVLGRVISPNASTNPNVQLLKKEGVSPTLGQTLGGRWNTVEEKLMSVPVVGDAIASARTKAQEQFNTAAINRATAPVGARVEGFGQDAIRKAGDKLSDAYDDALKSIKGVSFDQQFMADFTQLRGMAQSLTPPLRNKFNTEVQNVFSGRLSQANAMLPETYKKVDSELGRLAARYGKSSVASEQELGDAFTQMQALLKQQMLRSNPDVAGKLKKADEGWANLVRIEQAGKTGKNNEGFFTPGQLNGAIAQKDGSTRGRAVARGTALMQDLGNAGQQVLGNKVPDSGTAGRLFMGGGAAFLDPTGVTPWLLGSGAAMYLPPARGLLSGAVSARPDSAQTIAEALRKSSPGLGLLSGQVGAGLLNY